MSKRVHNTRKTRRKPLESTDAAYHPTKRRGGKKGQKVRQGPLGRSLKAIAELKKQAGG